MPEQFSGLVVVETDDLLGGGIGPKFEAAIEQLRKKYKFGKWKNLMKEQTEYGGRTLRQFTDFSFEISMTRYLKEKAESIQIARGRMKEPKAKCNDGEIRQLRGVIGKLQWASRMGMPQGSGDASILAATLPHPAVQELSEANAALRRLIENDVPVLIKSIPL